MFCHIPGTPAGRDIQADERNCDVVSECVSLEAQANCYEALIKVKSVPVPCSLARHRGELSALVATDSGASVAASLPPALVAASAHAAPTLSSRRLSRLEVKLVMNVEYLQR